MRTPARVSPSSAAPYWLAAGAAGATVTALALGQAGISGPWQLLALPLAVLTVIASGICIRLAVREKQETATIEAAVRQGETELEQLQEQLQRQAQLEQQLRHAKRTADAAVMAKGEFLATMSHEIRTPLNGIVPMLDLLMNARLAPDHSELVRTAYSSSQQLLRIVDDILDYSKLEADKLELEITAFNVRELLEGVIQLMERPAQSKGLRMHLQIEPGVRLPVRGDPVRLRQVLGNLLSNAVKFTERGSITVSVKRTGETTAQHQLRFEVRDTGVGIPQAAQSRLFQAFNQADASTTRLYGGTGLGLAISKRIVELMGGRIGVESETGEGATFWFDIPLLKVHGDMPAQDRLAEGARLLLLTSDQRLRARLTKLLPNWGLRVNSVETTQEALNRLRTAATQGPPSTYAIVLADLTGMRNTALALHRNLGRQAIYGELKLVCLYGDDHVPEELRSSATLLNRQAPDADLRTALIGDTDASPAGPKPAAPLLQEAAAAQETPATPRTPRVLLVEDNPVNLMVGQRLLWMLGIGCDTAGNGESALMRMSASRYDLVLMDCQMPVMDGYTATRQWRESEAESGSQHRLPIIAMTANAMAGDRQKCLDAGMDDYLPKPVTRSELERCIHHWWRPEEAAPSDEASAAQMPVADSAAVTLSPAPPPVPAAAVTPPPPPPPEPAPPPPPAPPAADAQPALPPVIDQSVIEELRAMLGNEVERLIDVFLEDTPKLLARLEVAASSQDYDAMREAAHSLKSSSANLGAMLLSDAAKRVEQGARERNLERPAVAVALVVNEFARARLMLKSGSQTTA